MTFYEEKLYKHQAPTTATIVSEQIDTRFAVIDRKKNGTCVIDGRIPLFYKIIKAEQSPDLSEKSEALKEDHSIILELGSDFSKGIT